MRTTQTPKGVRVQPEKEVDLFKIQEGSFTKFIALSSFICEEVIPSEANWISVEELHKAYKDWVENHSIWKIQVIDNAIGFSRKFVQLIGSHGWAIGSVRKGGVRGFKGVALKKQTSSKD